MKKMKLAAIFAGLVSVFTFSSCLNDSGGSSYDIYEIVTVVDGVYGNTALKGDGGYTYNPVASSVVAGLKDSKGNYYKRAQVGIKLMEGEVITQGQKSYKISEIGVLAILNYKDFNLMPDTLKNEYAIVSLQGSNNNSMWAVNGYVNVPFTFKTKETLSMDDFHLFAVEAKEDTLVTRLQQTKGADDAYQTGEALISFHMPFNGEFYEIFNELQPKNDTIVVKVTAKGENDKELVSTVKCSASNMQGF